MTCRPIRSCGIHILVVAVALAAHVAERAQTEHEDNEKDHNNNGHHAILALRAVQLGFGWGEGIVVCGFLYRGVAMWGWKKDGDRSRWDWEGTVVKAK